MVQVVYKKRRARTVLPQAAKPGASAPRQAKITHLKQRETRQRVLHLRQFGISGERNELLERMQDELDALREPTEDPAN